VCVRVCASLSCSSHLVSGGGHLKPMSHVKHTAEIYAQHDAFVRVTCHDSMCVLTR